MLYEPKAADHINIQKVIRFENIFLLLEFSRFGGEVMFVLVGFFWVFFRFGFSFFVL